MNDGALFHDEQRISQGFRVAQRIVTHGDQVGDEPLGHSPEVVSSIDHLGRAGQQLPLRQAVEQIQVGHHPHRLVKRTDEVLALLVVDVTVMTSSIQRVIVPELNLGLYVEEIRRILPNTEVISIQRIDGGLIEPQRIADAVLTNRNGSIRRERLAT